LRKKSGAITPLLPLVAEETQLTQSISQLSLKPSQEEAKKKDWWQFWK
jgi:hypothetical protein